MTRRTNARVAGVTFLAYIALGIPSMILMRGASRGDGIAARLASIAQHTTDVRIAGVLTLLCGVCAMVLAVTLWAITRDEDPDLALLGCAFRLGEGFFGVMSIQETFSLLWLATASGPNAPGAEGAHALGAYLVQGSGAAAGLFALGSTLFCWLLLRGRVIPTGLAWLGLGASILWVLSFLLEMLGVIPRTLNWLAWIPMAVFEIGCAFWMIAKGVAPPRAHAAVVAQAR